MLVPGFLLVLYRECERTLEADEDLAAVGGAANAILAAGRRHRGIGRRGDGRSRVDRSAGQRRRVNGSWDVGDGLRLSGRWLLAGDGHDYDVGRGDLWLRLRLFWLSSLGLGHCRDPG